MRINLLKQGLCLFLLLSLFFNSCKNYEDFDAVDGVEYNGELAVPLVYGSISLQDVLDDNNVEDEISSLVIVPDGTMKMTYENNQISFSLGDQYDTLPDFPLVIAENAVEYEIELFEEMTVEEMRLSSGSVRFELQASQQENVEVLITIPNLKKDGAVFNVTETIPYDGSAPSQAVIDPIDLTGYSLLLTDNKLQMYYQAVTASGDNVMIFPIIGMAENWEYEYLEGNWVTDTIPITRDTLNIDLFDNWVDGDITFADPRFSLSIENSFGFPTSVSIGELRVLSADGGSIVLESDDLQDGISLNYPTLMEEGIMKQTDFSLNNTNSNIDDILNARPKQIIYDLSTIVNPSSDENTTGFMNKDSKLNFAIKTELPIYGTASGFQIEEEMDMDMEDLENVESAEFKVIINNGMPIEADLQLYFLDDQDNKIDSLYADFEPIVKSAKVDNDGLVTTATESISFVNFDAARVARIKDSNKMLVGARFSTANEGNTAVQILSTHEMGVKIGMKVKLKE
ncbi:MAG: hypothetical protein AB8F74_08025 [Saprospiraceae bacterium]